MTDDGIGGFFDALAARGREPLWSKVTGTVRFEVVDGDETDRWTVTIDRGDVVVRHGDGDADCVIRAARPLFAGVCGGASNITAAVLRGEVGCHGDVELLFAVQRVFPGPPSTGRRPSAGASRG